MCCEKGSAKLCSEVLSIRSTEGNPQGRRLLEARLVLYESRFALPTVQFLFLTIIMSSERPPKNKPIGKIVRSLQRKLSSLLRLSGAPKPSLMDVDPRSDNDIATTNAAGTR